MADMSDMPHGLGDRVRRARNNYKFQVEGPWNIGDPVHESITHAALVEARLVAQDTRFNDPAIWEYLRGIFWNDDPEGFFFDHNDTQTNNWSDGVTFLRNFKTHQYAATNGTVFGPGTPLLARSHFGDLQCLHAMASCDGEAATATRDGLLHWAEFFYSVAIGAVSETTVLGKIDVGRICEWFPHSRLPVRTLLLVGQTGQVQPRAIGALLHIVQDSFAKGHVERNAGGAIVEFHSYVHQDSSKHAHDDAIPKGGLKAMPGVQFAIHHCAHILTLLKTNTPWPTVRAYLKTAVFPLALNVRPASAGADYDSQPAVS